MSLPIVLSVLMPLLGAVFGPNGALVSIMWTVAHLL